MIKIQKYNYETREMDYLAEVSARDLASSMTDESLVEFLDSYVNDYSKGFKHGKEIGVLTQKFHRTLQRTLICEILGILVGLSEQQYTDARNKAAIASAKVIANMLKEGDLSLGGMV